MALDKLIDSSWEEDCRTAEANAIRVKTGGSSAITYDWANKKGFADAIAAIGDIPSGGTDRLKTATLTLTQDYPIEATVGTIIKGLIDATIGTDYWVAVVSDAPSTMTDLTSVVCYLVKITSLNVVNMQGYDVNALGNNATSPKNACFWRTYSTVYPQGSYAANTNAKAYSGMTYQIWGWNA